MKIFTLKSPITLVMAAVLVLVAVLGGSVAGAASPVNVPVTASSEVAVTNIIESTTATSIRVQFDYALVNGATTGVVDASLNDQQSFGQVTVTGPGHYDETLSGITANSSSKVYVVSSGNPDFLIPSNNSCGNFLSGLLQLLKNFISQLVHFF